MVRKRVPDCFVVLWTVERCRWLKRVGDRGPLEVIFGGPHMSLPSIQSLAPGDTVCPVVVVDGGLFIVAGMQVNNLVPPEEFVRDHLGVAPGPHTMWDEFFDELKRERPSVGHRVPTTCADLAAVGVNGSEIRFDRKVPEQCLSLLHLGPKPGRERPLKAVVNGQLKNNFSLVGHVRRLSTGSAEIVSHVLNGAHQAVAAF